MPPYFLRVAKDWVIFFSVPGREDDYYNPFHIYEMIVRYEPFWALELICETIRLSKKNDYSTQMLIEGPLSEFLNSRGCEYYAEIGELMQSDASFRDALIKSIRLPSGNQFWDKILIEYGLI